MSNAFLGLISLFALIALNAFFVLAEYSLAVSRRTRIAEMVEKDNSAARVVLDAMRDPDRFFAATQVGITLTSMMIGAVSEPALSAIFEGMLGPLAISKEAREIIGAVIGLLVASYFQIVFAELVPRAITLRKAESVAVSVVPLMAFLAQIIRPFALLLRASARLVLRLLGVKINADQERIHSAAELRMLVEESEKGGALDSEQSEMLDNVFTFGDTTVREVMIPRTEMFAIEDTTPMSEVVHAFTHHSFDRIPVYHEALDNIIGILHLKDVLPAIVSGPRNITARQLMRSQLVVVPDTHRADELLQQLRARRESIAIVLDEYGGTAGLVTMNDLLAELVGEIGDSFSYESQDIQDGPDGSVLISGLTTLGDVSDKFNLVLVDPNYDTIGGYVMGKLGRIPHVGDEVELDAVGSKFKTARLRVEEMDNRRVAKLRLITSKE